MGYGGCHDGLGVVEAAKREQELTTHIVRLIL